MMTRALTAFATGAALAFTAFVGSTWSPSARADLAAAAVAGGLEFPGLPGNYFDPAMGYAPAGYGNSLGPTVVLSGTGSGNFAFLQGGGTVEDPGIDSWLAEFNGSQLTVAFRILRHTDPTSGATLTFKSDAFVGQTLVQIGSDAFLNSGNGGMTATLVGDTLTLSVAPQCGPCNWPLATYANTYSLAPTATFYGPTPYLQTADSPFYSLPGFQVETFEDGMLNLPGVTASVGTVVPPYPGNWYWTDSVDADDGAIDGLGYFGWSWWSTYGSGGTMTWTYDASQLGGHLPTHVGFVWTDGVIGRSDVTMEAFDGDGVSLGSITAYNLADGSYYGTTGEDRFFGVAQRDGISRIVITTGSEFEIDHVQYAYVVDPTAPVVQSSVTGTLGNNGWYVTDVQVAWTVSDPESPISATNGCDAASVATDSSGIVFTCSATSWGGATTESVTIKRDAMPPIATASAGPPATEYGWRRQNVTVSFAGTDAMSGGVTCDGPVILTTEGAAQSASGRCYDAAGNQSDLATASGINIDKTDPTVTIVSPVDGAVYRIGEIVYAIYSCDDSLSGIASCVGTVPNGQPIDTSKKVKNKKFTVKRTDKANNSTTATVTFSVIE